ncbi:FAD-containing monooxygenase EthA [Pseudomonas cavernae]|uniref:FAD-containing monooxygenase EthA n=1 Tax=Pseudomonas cavernae TaxID=2320867 RepID=A0A385Z0A2_9PSED|nr:FAD-dependent oxidoreductase [Pseudomonas cavernae]AYC31308.1 FAD-containing monooxygenase EthA [Pseudomonas cavernae]
MNKGVVIVGAGHGGVSLASALRAQEYTGKITLLSDEADYPYHRPPLSKAFISSDSADDEKKLLLEQESFYDEKQIDLRLGVRVTAIDTANQRVALSHGEALAYEHLILATGARARTLPLPGNDLQGIETLRTLADARRIRQNLANCQAVVVVGGGFIGLELAVTARQLGKQVTVLETASRIMERSVAPEVSEFVTQKHRAKGMTIELNACVEAFIGEQRRVSGVRCCSGERPADLVIVGAGGIANSELAQAAGIECGNGILVDAQLRTSAPNVFAIGDCASHEHAYAGGARVRLESIQNANDQARLVAQVICGSEARYQAVPWFWSDQGEVKLQMVGLSIGRTDCVTRGDPAQGRFSVFHYREQTLIAVDSINQPLEHIQSRKLLAGGISPDKALIADTRVDLKSLLG